MLNLIRDPATQQKVRNFNRLREHHGSEILELDTQRKNEIHELEYIDRYTPQITVEITKKIKCKGAKIIVGLILTLEHQDLSRLVFRQLIMLQKYVNTQKKIRIKHVAQLQEQRDALVNKLSNTIHPYCHIINDVTVNPIPRM